jgi:hypothetical protein
MRINGTYGPPAGSSFHRLGVLFPTICARIAEEAVGAVEYERKVPVPLFTI